MKSESCAEDLTLLPQNFQYWSSVIKLMSLNYIVYVSIIIAVIRARFRSIQTIQPNRTPTNLSSQHFET